jgi:hypothetical protein
VSRHLRSSLNLNRRKMRASLRHQLAGILTFALAKSATGEVVIHPGMERMADWGECSERVARENFAHLREHGVVVTVAYENGGRRATRFLVDLRALLTYLEGLGMRLSAKLLDKIRACRLWALKRLDKTVSQAQRNPEVSSAGIHKRMGLLSASVAAAITNVWPWARLPASRPGFTLSPSFQRYSPRPGGLISRIMGG